MAGVRPENLENVTFVAAAAPESVLDISAELREELGPEVNAHCTVGVAPLRVALSISDSEPDAAEIEEVRKSRRSSPGWIRTGIREGERVRIHVDLDSLHFFDPDTGDNTRG